MSKHFPVFRFVSSVCLVCLTVFPFVSCVVSGASGCSERVFRFSRTCCSFVPVVVQVFMVCFRKFYPFSEAVRANSGLSGFSVFEASLIPCENLIN